VLALDETPVSETAMLGASEPATAVDETPVSETVTSELAAPAATAINASRVTE
jgi:hypothetical protein